MYDKEQLRRIFQARFNAETWNAVLRNIVKADELRREPETITDPADCDRGYYLGAKNTADSYRIGLFLYELSGSNVARKRVGLRNLVKTFINPRWGQFDAALAVFTDGNQWRLSFISDIKGEATSPKRYTFVFGEQGNLYRTAIERFQMLQDKGVTFETLKEAFSVEALSKEFFDQYKEHYLRFCEFIYDNADNREWFGQEFAEWNAKEDTRKYIRDYVKNLLGRLVFLQFLQKKGWLGVDANSDKWEGGDTNFMYNLFAKASRIQKENFLDEILEPLFFDCINTRRGGDVFDTKVAGIGRVRIPYLNGGLFEQKDIDRPKSRFPQQLFADLLEFFTQYNFTIDENDPNDAEIGVDPEMLGKIFENLLEDNKDKGAFYTPKEIVQYMCRESIDAYLRAHKDDGRTELELLQQVKVCDPAIGSGAFPMGILNELLHRRIALGETVRADIKREIIQQNIYGVDIERGAVDIARLRFWLALVVDSAEPEPLPNLDYKIMQGNSLLEQYKGVDLSRLAAQKTEKECGMQLSWFDDITDVKRKDLQDLLNKYYSQHEDKAPLREEIKQNVLVQLRESGINASVIADLSQINLAANDKFFLWHTWFADVFNQNGGFDIVIGNPPYIEAKKLKHIASTLKTTYKVYTGTSDISAYFIELGTTLAKQQGGVLNYITTNKFFNTGYGKPVRKHLLERKINQLINFEQVEVFEGVLVSSVILMTTNLQAEPCDTIAYEKFYKLNAAQFRKEFVERTKFGTYPQDLLDENEWSFSDVNALKLKRKIEAAGCPVKDLAGVSVYRGVTTGFNPAFIIDDAKRDELIAADPNNRQIIKKLLQGRNIRKWYYNESDECLLQTGYDIDIQKSYPVVFSHLMLYHDAMASRSDQGKNWYNLRACKYYSEFEKPKIIWGLTADKWAYTIDRDNHYLPSNGYIMTSTNVPLEYLLGILNSNALRYYFGFIGVMTAGGAYTLKAATIESLPIPSATPEQQQPIIDLVNQILSAKQNNPQADTSALERRIDELVYQLYGLNEDEIEFINPAHSHSAGNHRH